MQFLAPNGGAYNTQQLLVLMQQGDNTPITFLFSDDISNQLFECTIKFPTTLTLSSGTGIVISEFSNYAIFMQIDTDVTENIPCGRYPFDLWSMDAEDPSINNCRLSGFIVINKSNTRIS